MLEILPIILFHSAHTIIPLSMPDYSLYSIDYSIFSVHITSFIKIFLFLYYQ